MTKDEALKLALDYIDNVDYGPYDSKPVLAAIKAALAQPEQEPVAWWDAKIGFFEEKHFDQLQPLYTTPPAAQRTWVGLTPKQVAEIVIYPMNKTADLVRAIEAKLKENNHV